MNHHIIMICVLQLSNTLVPRLHLCLAFQLLDIIISLMMIFIIQVPNYDLIAGF